MDGVNNKKDFYTQTAFRKLGFLDEYGEALRPILSASSNPILKQFPNFAYIPATAYMIADVADKYQKGEDGTGKEPSVKMAVREAAYQGIVSMAAPVAIVKGVHKAAQCLTKKLPETKGLTKVLSKNKFTKGIVEKAGMPGKILGAAVSIAAVSKLSKSVDIVVGKIFDKVVDPAIGIQKTPEKEDK